MAAIASQFFTQEVPLEFAEYLKEWMSDSNVVSILVTGQIGSGKSTVFLPGFLKVPERQTLLRTKATGLKRWQSTIGNIQVSMWDSGQPPTDKEKAKTIEDIQRNCRDIDLCLFCVDMSNPRFTPEYTEAIKDLSEIP